MSAERSLRLATCALALGAAFVAGGCEAYVRPGVAVVDVRDYPPDEYVATIEPYYYEGHASYWYDGRWYYRDGGRWGHYDREPPHLRELRVRAAPVPRVYEPRVVAIPVVRGPSVRGPSFRPVPRGRGGGGGGRR